MLTEVYWRNGGGDCFKMFMVYGMRSCWRSLGVVWGDMLVGGSSEVWPRHSSTWWKDLVKLDIVGDSNWFNSELVRKVGNGLTTTFWKALWRGGTPFWKKYPRLFSISNLKDGCVGDYWRSDESRGGWRFSWRRTLFVWEEELVISLRENLEGHKGV